MSYFNVNTVLIGRLLNIFQILTVKTVQTYTCFGLKYKLKYLPPATKLGQGYIFTGVCDSVHGGGGVCMVARGEACVVAGGMCGCEGYAWLPRGHAWLQGAVCGCRRGHAWLWGGMHGCLGGMHGCLGGTSLQGVSGCWGHVWLPGGMRGCRGVCMVARGYVWLLGGMRRARRDTVNEQAGRILLECILV